MRPGFSCFLLAGLLVPAAGLADDPAMVTGDPAAGAGKYREACEVCHGPGGNSTRRRPADSGRPASGIHRRPVGGLCKRPAAKSDHGQLRRRPRRGRHQQHRRLSGRPEGRPFRCRRCRQGCRRPEALPERGGPKPASPPARPATVRPEPASRRCTRGCPASTRPTPGPPWPNSPAVPAPTR